MTKLKLHDYIKKLLEDNPKFRDSDKKLQWAVWQDLGYVSGGVMYFDMFLKATSTETIRRTRQKVQENNPWLRSSQTVEEAKIEKQYTKGTFIYRGQIKLV